ncbi:AraC family transcriptional regulator [Paenibacillus sp. CC-CFT747]|nr:AraC family transcriptional regulator [Paenibacillus sp. CC-CFT747]
MDSEWVGVADEFGDKMTVIKKREVPEGAGGKGSGVTLFRKIMIQGQFKGIVAVNLNDDKLFAKLSPPVLNNLNRMRYIIDEEDQVLYSVSNYDFDESAIRQALKELREDGSGDITHQNRKLLVNQLVSPVTGWKYVSIVVQDSLLAKSKTVRNAVLIVSLAALALGGMTIYYINAASFRPVRRLKQLFSDYSRKSAEPEGIDLEKLAGELLSNHAHLSQLVRETLSEASSKLLYDMYTGNITGKREMEEKWSRYFADWTPEPVTAAILSIDRYGEWARTYSGADQSLLKFAAANIVGELFEQNGRVLCADIGKDKLAVLLQPRDAGMEPGRKLEEAIQVIFRLLKFKVSIGISTPQAEIVRLPQALLEAKNALTYRLYEGYGKLLPFGQVSGHEVREPVGDGGLVEELTRRIESGDEAGALETAGRIIEEVRSQYGYPTAALSYLRTALESVEQLRQAEEDSAADYPSERLDTLDLDDIREELVHRVKPLVQRYHRLVQSKDFLTCQRMIEYMKQHLGEPIGIPEIADEAGISGSLASQLFKQETGKRSITT